MQQTRRLYKSPEDRLLFGVAGGHAEYFDIDPVIVRVAWVVLTIVTGGIAALVYLVLAIVTPTDHSRPAMAAHEDEPESEDADYREQGRRSSRGNTARYVVAGILIAMGVLFLLGNLGIFQSIRWDIVWPVAVIALGLAILIPSIRR